MRSGPAEGLREKETKGMDCNLDVGEVPEGGEWLPPAFGWKIHHQTAECPITWWTKVLPDGRLLGVGENRGRSTFYGVIAPAGMTDDESMSIEVGHLFRSAWTAKKAVEEAASVGCSSPIKSGHRNCRKRGRMFAYDTRTWHCRQHWGRRTTDDEEISQASCVSGS